jgi:hypothetical protein
MLFLKAELLQLNICIAELVRKRSPRIKKLLKVFWR